MIKARFGRYSGMTQGEAPDQANLCHVSALVDLHSSLPPVAHVRYAAGRASAFGAGVTGPSASRVEAVGTQRC